MIIMIIMARSYVSSSKHFVEYINNIIMFGGNKNGNTTIIQVTKMIAMCYILVLISRDSGMIRFLN